MAEPSYPRWSPAELVAELREAAEEIAPELNGIRAEETLEGESAQMIEEMAEALKRIAAGAPRPQEIARAALAAQTPRKPVGVPKPAARKPLPPSRTPGTGPGKPPGKPRR